MRWQVQQPGFITPSKVAKVACPPESLAIFDFAPTENEMAAIHALARPDGRIVNAKGLPPDWD